MIYRSISLAAASIASLVFSSLPLSQAYDSAYVESQSLRYVDFSGAAYCTDPHIGKETINNWSCKVCKKYPGVTATTFHGSKTDANGYVAYDPAKNEVIVAFSGTDPLSVANWIDDIDTKKTAYPYCSGCEVHDGFYRTFQSVSATVLNLTKSMLSSHSGAKLFVTGHSLGAAMAAHCAAEFVHQGMKVSTSYSYGMPRVGNQKLEEWFKSVVPGMFRLVHHKDPVPHLPANNWGFHHMPYEVFYTKEYTNYKVCNFEGEDSSCSNQYTLDLNVGE
jgi:predicted lipase